jgi:two-component system, NtrC family, response regulator AtoC
VDDPSLSRQHARFRRTERQIMVEDLGSRNGTLVDGERVEQAVVNAGQRIALGNVIAAVQWVSELARRMTDLDEYDRFGDLVDYELRRSRYLERQVSLLMLRSTEASDSGHVRRWYASVKKALRPLDSLTAYDARSLLVLLPETSETAARSVAEAALGRGDAAFGIRAGIATAPSTASTREGLIARVEEALLAANSAITVSALISDDGMLGRTVDPKPIVAVNSASSELYDLVSRVAAVDVPVLITGETGSGKELVAAALHRQSARSKKPLRAVNCGAIPSSLVEASLFGHEKGAFTGARNAQKGLFEQASGGTLLLDEIGELSLSAQAALLRVLETQKLMRIGGATEINVDVRVVAATHRNLDQMVRDGRFRLDLLFRLNTIVLEIPPLRERVDEIAAMVEHFISKTNQCLRTSIEGVDAEALRLLCVYRWPGNVRELRNVIERACVLSQGSILSARELPDRFHAIAPRHPESGIRVSAAAPSPAGTEGAPSFQDQVRTYETAVLLHALREADWNQRRAATLLEMPLRTLVRKMGIHGIKKRFESEGGD